MTTVTLPWTPNDLDGCSTPISKVYPDLHNQQVDPIQVAADFYLCEGIATHSFLRNFTPVTPRELSKERLAELAEILGLGDEATEIRARRIGTGHEDRLTRIGKAAHKYQKEMVKTVVPSFRWYSHLACGGELRYSKQMVGVGGVYKQLSYSSNFRQLAWVGWKKLFDKYGLDALQAMIDLFDQMGGHLKFGGPPWGVCAKVLLDYETGILSDKLFLDRVLALEHHNGCFLNKRPWANYRKGREEPWVAEKNPATFSPRGKNMQAVLDCHDVNPPNVLGLFSCASDNLRPLIIEYFSLAAAEGFDIVGTWDQEKVLNANSAAGVELDEELLSKLTLKIDTSEIVKNLSNVGVAIKQLSKTLSKTSIDEITASPFSVQIRITRQRASHQPDLLWSTEKHSVTAFAEKEQLLTKIFDLPSMLQPGREVDAFEAVVKSPKGISANVTFDKPHSQHFSGQMLYLAILAQEQGSGAT